MKKLIVILLILIIIPSVFAFSLLDFLKNLNLDITGYYLGNGGSEPNIAISPTSLSFGDVIVGQSIQKTLIVVNTGNANLIVTNIITPGIITKSQNSFTIIPSSSNTVTFTFTPTSTIQYTGNIIIQNNDPDTPSLLVPYTGYGISTQNQCQQAGGICRDSCLQNEQINYDLSQYCPTQGTGTGSVTQQYCCMPITQNQCELSGGVCRDSCLQNEQIDYSLTQYCPLTSPTGSATQQYCCKQICQENWDCTSWSSCINNQQTRTCSDLNNCGTTLNKPPVTQSCTTSCGNILNNQCSTIKPFYCENGNLIENCNLCGCPLNQECINNECITINPSINLAPIWSDIEDLTFSLNQLSLYNLLNLNNYVTDPESQTLTITFNNNQLFFNSDVIDCYISNNIFNCNPPKKTGSIDIVLKASDSEKFSTTSFEIEILQQLGVSGVVGALSNTAPVADAGPDIIAYPNQKFILDASQSYDKENNIPSIDSSYIWYENQQKIGEGILLKRSYNSKGTYKIILQVTDSSGSSSTDSLTVHVIDKKQCRFTSTIYFPIDTKCDKKWPSKELEIININSPIYSCNLFEVCSDELDYIIEDAIDCCDNTPSQDPKKVSACNFANKYSNKNAKKCQSLYLIKSLGGSAIYMQNYFESEMCCYAVEGLCSNPLNLYTARPIPNALSLLDLNKMLCPNTPSSNKVGSWISDTKIELNNIALSEVPTHVSIDQLSTGTCVDYSSALTTLLRKSGYRKDEVYTVEASTHAYNLIKLPGDKKYTIVDTTGNNDGLKLGSVPTGYEYCKEIKNCYNDNGEAICPRLKEINGCENIKEPFTFKTKIVGYKISSIIKDIYDRIIYEVER